MEQEPTSDETPESKWKQVIRKIFLYDIPGSIALGLAIISLVNDCGDSQRDERNQELLNRLNYRPRLEVVKIELDTYKPEKIDLKKLKPDINGIATVSGTATIKLRLFIANTGNHPATLISKFYYDTTSGNQIIKEMLSRKERNMIIERIPDSYYPEKIINEGDTIKDWVTFPINFIKDSTFTFHTFLVYQNEADQTFDTYYRERFMLIPIVIPITGVSGKYKIDQLPIVSIDKSPNTSRGYNPSEADKLLKSIENVLN